MKENNHFSFITDIERNLVINIKQKQFELTFTMIFYILPINPLFLFPTSEKD